MEIAKVEIAAVENAQVEAEVKQLNDLELALVGGGSGDVVWK